MVEKEEMFSIASNSVKALSYDHSQLSNPTDDADAEVSSSRSNLVSPAVPVLLEKQRQFASAYSSHQAALNQREHEFISSSTSQSLLENGSPIPVGDSVALSNPSPSLNLSSAQMSQLAFLPEEKSDHLNPSTLQLLFPAGHRDVNNQQIDLRNHNSWTMKLDEVPTVELAEVFAINTIAPTILNARLKPLMKRSKPIPSLMGNMNWKFIVNVSAMEGKFYRYKSSNHPHTNMAKAALNMMTRTSAQDYIKDNIYMTAVDTGWINDEKPIERAMKHEERHDFQTPLDEIDAASRVLDPVIGPLKALQDILADGDSGAVPTDLEPPWGYFIKDYMKSEW